MAANDRIGTPPEGQRVVYAHLGDAHDAEDIGVHRRGPGVVVDIPVEVLPGRVGVHLVFGRIVASEIEAPKMLVNLVQRMSSSKKRQCGHRALGSPRRC
jgi:hypothetical protein